MTIIVVLVLLVVSVIGCFIQLIKVNKCIKDSNAAIEGISREHLSMHKQLVSDKLDHVNSKISSHREAKEHGVDISHTHILDLKEEKLSLEEELDYILRFEFILKSILITIA